MATSEREALLDPLFNNNPIALQVLGIMRREERTLSEIAEVMQSYPQVLINVPVAARPPIEELLGLTARVAAVSGEHE